MSSISGISGSSNAWASQRSAMQARMFAKVDADNSNSVDASELQTMLTDVSKHTGTTFDKSAKELLTSMDSDGNGALSSDELAQGMQSLMPPPSTMDFAQSRAAGDTSASGKDDLFAKVDSDGNGSISKDELTQLSKKMGKTDTDSADQFAKLDTDKDGTLSQAEFDAGRPQGQQGGTQGAGAMSPPPPPGGMGAAGGTEESSSTADSTTYDALDTNEDGVVSEMERLAGELKELAKNASGTNTSSSANGASSSSALNEESATQAIIAKLAQKLYDQISTSTSGLFGNASSASTTTTTTTTTTTNSNSLNVTA